MKYHVVYSYNSIHDSNIEEQGAIECRNFVHAVLTYILAYHGAYEEIAPAGCMILSKAFHLEMTIVKY